MKRYLISLLAFAVALLATAADPTATSYNRTECQGSSMPYPTPEKLRQYPDSMVPVLVNHVGRHGARFPASGRYVASVVQMLHSADSMGTITPQGRKLVKLCEQITRNVDGQWGALDSLGMAEQRAIASRMFATFRPLLGGDKPVIKAYSSYSPRCIASMDEFTHQLARLNNKVEMWSTSGRQNSPLLRFFDLSEDYKAYIAEDKWRETLDTFISSVTPQATAAAQRVLGDKFPLTDEQARKFALDEYKVVSGCQAMSIVPSSATYFTEQEYNALWACENLRHYLTYAASTLSTEPADMASPLLANLVETTQAAIDDPDGVPAAILRFGHAETLMPLLSLMHLPGCYYMTNYFDTVAMHWRDWYVVPMAANLQLILFRVEATGNYYVRVDLNETPVPLIPGRTTLYTPWAAARDYMTRCIPMYLMEN